MTSKFAASLFAGIKDGPSLFFAPVVGAIKGIRVEMTRVVHKQQPMSSPAPKDRQPER